MLSVQAEPTGHLALERRMCHVSHDAARRIESPHAAGSAGA